MFEQDKKEPVNKLSSKGSVWHTGERQLQASAKVEERMALVGPKVIRDHMPEQHQTFYAQLSYIFAGVVDSQGMPWATLLINEPSFLQALSAFKLQVDITLSEDDPACSGFREGAGIGLLGIELNSRRRNRINGRLAELTSTGFKVNVEQTMGNCPKYIALRDTQRRSLDDASQVKPQDTEHSNSCNAQAIHQIQQADSFYVASYDNQQAEYQVDISHRGGRPGFVKVCDDGSLLIPDFQGNMFFNTLGNIVVTNKAGLIFLNDQGDVLQMSGYAEVILASQALDGFEGAQRLWRFKPQIVVRRAQALPIRWALQELSPFSLAQGHW